MKTKNFCAKDIKKVKRQHTKWEKIFTNHISDEGPVCEIYKESYNLAIKKANHLIKKWAKGLNTDFSQKMHMTNKHIQRCSTSLVKRKMQIKTTMRYHSLGWLE